MNTVLFVVQQKQEINKKEFPIVWVLDQGKRKPDPEYLEKIRILTSSHSYHVDNKLYISLWHQSGFEMIQGVEEGGPRGAEQSNNNPTHRRCALGLFLLLKHKDRLGPCLMGKC